jgi:RsiW-degrading membrane proteinase PrsW (M82 family)
MTYPFQKPVQDASDGRTSLAFRLTGAILAGAAVLMFFMVGTGAGLAGPGAWIAAVAAAGAVFVLAPVLIAIIMVVVPPVLIVVVIVRLAASAV